MPKRIDDATREAIRKDAAAGMNLNAIAEKHGVAWGTARDIVAKSAVKIPRVERGGKLAKKRKYAIAASNGVGSLTPTPAVLDALWSALPIEKKIGVLNFIYSGTHLAGGGVDFPHSQNFSSEVRLQ